LKRTKILSLFILITVCVNSQTVLNLDTLRNTDKTNSNASKPLFSDTLSSSFCIFIPNEVPAHKHVFHSEQVVVLEGTGIMRLGDKSFPIQKGDLIFIPKNTVHAVRNTGTAPLKVLSIQAPYFDGKDRVFVNENMHR
jgi:mannose-6-phosphate isomerase-like protein (cupin superfamily)